MKIHIHKICVSILSKKNILKIIFWLVLCIYNDLGHSYIPKSKYLVSQIFKTHLQKKTPRTLHLRYNEDSTARGLNFLMNQFSPVNGFQNSHFGKDRADLFENFCPAAERFTSAVALDLLSWDLDEDTKRNLADYIMHKHMYGSLNFNRWESFIPDDVDTTALTHYVLLREGFLSNQEQMKDVIRLILLNTNKDGAIQTYLPPRGHRENRICPIVLSNCLRLVYSTGYAHEDAFESENYLWELLNTKDYIQEKHYSSEDVCVYNASRAIVMNSRTNHRFRDLLVEHVIRRLNTTQFPIDIASRILASIELKLVHETEMELALGMEVENLLNLQNDDGSWPADCLFKTARDGYYFGGKEISTIFAAGALLAYRRNLDCANRKK